MPIFTCPKCKRDFEVGDSDAIRAFPCSNCGEKIELLPTKRGKHRRPKWGDRGYRPYQGKSDPIKLNAENVKMILSMLLFVILLFSCVLWYTDDVKQTKRNMEEREKEEMHEKAEVLRRHGAEGSDWELSRVADKIKEVNQQEQARDATERRVLGNQPQ